MKLLPFLMLLVGYAYGQAPTQPARRDSLPGIMPGGPIPTIKSENSFYRREGDPQNVVRANLDNMPIKVPDSSILYADMPNSVKPYQPSPHLAIPPLPPGFDPKQLPKIPSPKKP